MSIQQPRMGVLGATGAVGTLVCRLLEQRKFPHRSIRFFGSPGHGDRTIEFAGGCFPVEPASRESLVDLDLVIGSTADEIAARCGPWVVQQGGVFVDESAHFRLCDDVPLVIPEINPQSIAAHCGIVSSPNCSTTQLAICLKPILDAFGIRRVVVSTYQAASGAGHAARQELLESTLARMEERQFVEREFEPPLTMNVVPKIGQFRDDGYTSEEYKMLCETRKILELPDLPINVTCVRVPIENCHSESVVVETEAPVAAETVREHFENFPGIQLLDVPSQGLMPMPSICDDRDEVFVGRIRRDFSVQNGIAFWCVSDNLRKGAATNAVQIAELLLQR